MPSSRCRAEEVLPDGRQRVVRHGQGPKRSIQTGTGALDVCRPKVRDRAAAPDEEKIRFTSAMLAFCDFKAEHRDHLRSGNPIESVFATVRHRTVRTKGALSQKTANLMVFKLVQAAAKTWRRLKGANQLPLGIEGVTSTDGVALHDTKSRAA